MDHVSKTVHLLQGDEQRYDTPHDVAMRLSRTIVRFEGEPIYVTDIADNLEIYAYRIGSGYPRVDFFVSSNDARLDVSSPPLGYLNYGNDAFYVMRRPIRSQRQGLNPQDAVYFSARSTQFVNFGVDSQLLVAYGDMLRRKYPSVKKITEEGWTSGAFSRTWALSKIKSKKGSIYLLLHRTEPVGTYKNGTFTIHKSASDPVRLTSLRNVLSKQIDGGSYVIVE